MLQRSLFGGQVGKQELFPLNIHFADLNNVGLSVKLIASFVLMKALEEKNNKNNFRPKIKRSAPHLIPGPIFIIRHDEEDLLHVSIFIKNMKDLKT